VANQGSSRMRLNGAPEVSGNMGANPISAPGWVAPGRHVRLDRRTWRCCSSTRWHTTWRPTRPSRRG
jgi:hypothetical protein